MAFVKQDPRPFTRPGIDWLNPNQTGVYGIFREGQWIYVGKGDLKSRLLDHLNGDVPCIIHQAPTHFLAEVTAASDSRERELILELNPICNRRVG